MLSEHSSGDMLKKIQRQVQHMPKSPGSYPKIDFIGGMEQQVISEKIKSAIHRQGYGHAKPQDVQGGEGLIHQHLINDDLKKNRGNQGNGIDEQDGQGNVHKGFFLPQDLRNKPAQTERLCFVGEFEGTFKEINFTIPKSFELLTGQA